jgi:hypothetical protein
VDAQSLVTALLEDENIQSVCSQCEKDFGPAPVTGMKSHGMCMRHAIEQVRDFGMAQAEIDDYVNGVLASGGFAPDRAQAESTDVDFSMDYIEGASVPWNPLRLITSKEWRAFFRGLGFKIKSFYVHQSTGKRQIRFAHLSMSLVPADGHLLDWQDEKLVTEYTYQMLEKRLTKDRREMGLVINCWATAGNEAWIDRKGQIMNQLNMTLALPRGDEEYRSYHPLYDY